MKNALLVLIIVLVLAGAVFYLNNNGQLSFLNNIIPQSYQTPAPVYNTPAPTLNPYVVSSRTSPTLGPYLTDAKGMTLYTFSDDTGLKSTCTGTCAKTWPPFIYQPNQAPTSSDDTKLYTKMNTFNRSTGLWQYAYGLKPVYYYTGDVNPGDTKGNGVGGKWSVVQLSQ